MNSLSTAKPLIERKSHDLEALFRTMGERLTPSGEKGRLQFRIHDKSGNTNWVISLGDGGPRLDASKVDHPHLEILTQKETMLQMAEGTLTPTVAFYRGQMRVRGDIELGKRLLTHLGSPDGEMWKPAREII
jgi:predicted lipid carrier protein YhbT